jgi:Flp pilus assembly protein TadG
MMRNYPTLKEFPSQHRQWGAALPLVTIGLLAMLAVAGLAVDASHALTNKTRLQSTTDAAALAAAKEYDNTADIITANAAARSLFGLNADGAGNHELNDAYDANEIGVTIQWSETVAPFVNTGLGPYVRVIATGFDVDTTLSSVLGIVDIDVGASAVAGPSPSILNACNLAPLVVCAEDPDDSDLFGFEEKKLKVLKSASGDPSDIGPGNFQLARLGCSGGNCVRENLAGGYDGCVDYGETVETEPGNTVGPTVQGLNTRFDSYSGPVTPGEYPPDVNVTEPSPPLTYDGSGDTINQNGQVADASTIDYGWDQYVSDIANDILTNPPELGGVYDRRVLAVPVADCSVDSSGQSTLSVVGFGCYFLLQQVVQKGNEAQIFGQFIEGCNAGGVAGPDPVEGPGPYLIQLYKDPDSVDS